MEHISLTCHNKKGVSMVELIAYVVLYGAVMSLLASLTFVIITSARKVNRQAILNRGTTIMFTEILSQTVALAPDYVSDVDTSVADTISITFEKRHFYDDDGVRHDYAEDEIQSIKYVYNKGDDNIVVIRNNDIDNSGSINLEYGMIIQSVNSDSIDDVIEVNKQSSFNKYVTFHGNLIYDDKPLEFKFIIPVFITD